MAGEIFLIRNGGELTELHETAYEKEADLQELLERYPQLLPGAQIDPERPRRWLLIGRELSVHDDDGSARWSLDHLFVDQDGVPTLVEVKRSTDTRIRREVVGQMLDYAANAAVHWPADFVESQFAAWCESKGIEPELAVAELSPDTEYETFWTRVKTNLQAGRLRLIFVADHIPAELRRVVEFLNEQTDPAEVLAVEIPQFAGGGLQTLVPRVLGHTAGSAQRRTTVRSKGKTWDRSSWLDEIEERNGSEIRAVAGRIMDWSDERKARITFGSGTQNASYWATWDIGEHGYFPWGLWTHGGVEIQFQWLVYRPPFDREEIREALRLKLNEIPGVDIGADRITYRPSFELELLQPEESMQMFFDITDWVVEQARTYWTTMNDASATS